MSRLSPSILILCSTPPPPPTHQTSKKKASPKKEEKKRKEKERTKRFEKQVISAANRRGICFMNLWFSSTSINEFCHLFIIIIYDCLFLLPKSSKQETLSFST
ncbi:hypothetical protein HAX54_019932 [Datura stramonium]|uniref:Uncharacterized protein n=1 Tax=Datura stramonium TaxID=4076 RepID=A0ABS8UQ72_DATST|nr:hypothetical protein [Datura stramonium]